MRKAIPLGKPLLGDDEKRAVCEVIDSGVLVSGPRVAAFEAAFAAYVGARHAVATSTGTSALHLALLAHGIGTGDEVVTTPFSFFASTSTILFAGAVPVFADVDPSTMNLDPAAIERAIGPKTKAILPVHLFGLPCDRSAIRAIGARRGLVVIEDAAQALGAETGGGRIGATGTAAFSLHATKNATAGEGGMVTTDDDDVASRIRLLRNHGMRERQVHATLGGNHRMTEIAAAIGHVQLGKLPRFLEARRANAAALSAAIEAPEVVLPTPPKEGAHAFQQFTIRVPAPHRDPLRAALDREGIATGLFYPKAIPRQEAVAHLGLRGDVPAAEALAREVLSLPVHPGLEEGDARRIGDAVNAYFRPGS